MRRLRRTRDAQQPCVVRPVHQERVAASVGGDDLDEVPMTVTAGIPQEGARQHETAREGREDL